MPVFRHAVACVMSLALVLWARESAAVEIGKPEAGPTVDVHGFVSPGFILTTQNNYLAKSKRGSFEFAEVGLNVTAPVTDKLRTGIQLFTHDLGPIGNYAIKADWFYIDYRAFDWLGFRAGRVKIPFGLYNEINDVDAARVPILLPQSIYSATSRDLLLAQTGAELYGRIDMRAAGALEYRHYFGTIFLDPQTQTSVQTQVTNIDVPFVAGQRLMWETPLEGLRAGASMQALKLDLDFILQNKPVSINIPAFLWVASVEYAAHDLLLAAEYSRWRIGITTNNPALFPQSAQESESERGYAMASYRLGIVQPGVYYSLFYPDTRVRSGPAASQHDVAATLRFDINPWWLFKLEGHFMSGTAGLSTALNDNAKLDSLERRWGVFLAKTTVHF